MNFDTWELRRGCFTGAGKLDQAKVSCLEARIHVQAMLKFRNRWRLDDRLVK